MIATVVVAMELVVEIVTTGQDCHGPKDPAAAVAIIAVAGVVVPDVACGDPNNHLGEVSVSHVRTDNACKS
jgi:hypothetical protein